jgi:uncharacterized membrane protein YfcA
VDLKVATVAGLSGAVTAIMGGMIADSISTSLSNIMFAFLLLFVAGTQLVTLRSDRRTDLAAAAVIVD